MAAASSASSAAVSGPWSASSKVHPRPNRTRPAPPPPKNDVMPGPDDGLARHGLLRRWLRRGRRLGIRCRGGSLAEDVREGSGGIAARRIGGRRRRRRRRRRRGDGGVIEGDRDGRSSAPASSSLASAVTPAAPSARHRRRPRSAIAAPIAGGPACPQICPRCLEQPPLSQPRRCPSRPLQRFHSSGSRRPRRRLLRAGRPRSRTRMVELLRRLHPRRSFIASTRHPRPRPSEPRRSRPEYKCYFEKSRICCRDRTPVRAGRCSGGLS